MEENVLSILHATQISDTNIIRHAEESLKKLYPISDFPLALLNIASHTDIAIGNRKAALTTLKKYVESTWSTTFEEASFSNVNLPEEVRSQIRSRVLAICTSAEASNKQGQSLAASVVSKIASVDFPDQWPDLFPHLISILNVHDSDASTLGALRVMHELVDSGLSENQFFTVAPGLVNALKSTTEDTGRDAMVQAMALKVLSSSFDNLEQVLETLHGQHVKGFLEESVRSWMPYFTSILIASLPEIPPELSHQGVVGAMRAWKGTIALKIQVVQTLAKIKRVHVASITPYVFGLFHNIWDDLSKLDPAYEQLFIENDGEGKLVDKDGLPYTLDALIIEEVDFLTSVLQAKAVRRELEKQSNQIEAGAPAPWLQELIRIMVKLSRIPTEEQNMWEFDANIYLCETTSITSKYTARAACAELVARALTSWLGRKVVEALVYYSAQIQSQAALNWKGQEALLNLMREAFRELYDTGVKLEDATVTAVLQSVSNVSTENQFLAASAHLVLGALFLVSSTSFYEASISAARSAIKGLAEQESLIVCVSCAVALPQHIEVLPRSTSAFIQEPTLNALQSFLSNHSFEESGMEDADDVKGALVTLLRDAILVDPASAVNQDSPALGLFFTLCSSTTLNIMLAEQLVEAFELFVERIGTEHSDLYPTLCSRSLSSITATFHMANFKVDSELTALAVEFVSRLAEHGPAPLPPGMVRALMPPLNQILTQDGEADLLRPATTAMTFLLEKGSAEYLEFSTDLQSSTEITLLIISRLLSSSDLEESASENVGGLATALVKAAGASGLGSHLADLLNAIAARLITATRIQFIQSLLMVFASLAAQAPSDVITFLAQSNSLESVMTKWLENTVHFAGFDEIRQNNIALSQIYALHDPRIHAISVKGDLIVQDTGRIKTRSQAKANPDIFTTISADLKILKLLVDELKNAAVSGFTDADAALAAKSALDDLDSEGEDDGDWEDDDFAPGNDESLDLSSEKVRNQLMGFAGEGADLSEAGSRLRDDESADYLMNWFRSEGRSEGFVEMFNQLKPEEQDTLRELVK